MPGIGKNINYSVDQRSEFVFSEDGLSLGGNKSAKGQ